MTGDRKRPAPGAGSQSEATTRQIRGSTMLMVGRGVSLLLNFAAQILTVRYLAKHDYGALAWALAMVSLLSRFARFGMDKAASRFAAIHHEREEYGKLFGALLLMASTIVVLGGGALLTVRGLSGTFGPSIVSDPLSLALLLTLIALAPVEALDMLLQAVFAVFSRPRLIFFRKHVVGPSLKVLAVLAVILAAGDVRMLAVAHLVAGVLGLVIGLSLVTRVFGQQHLLSRFKVRDLELPVRKIVGFGVPMMISDVVFIARATVVVLLLEYFHGSSVVADYRAVVPVARLNRVAMDSFAFLFMPAVARLVTRGDTRSLNDLYWRSAVWVALLSAPAWLATVCLAQPVTVLLFGERYAGSAVVLAILSVGIFINASLELSGLALKAAGRVRHVMTIDALAVGLTFALTLLLIPRFGAVGGAASLSITLALHSGLYQVGLARATGVKLFPGRFTRVYALLAAATLVVGLTQLLASPPLWVGIPLIVAVWLVVLRLSSNLLDVRGTFPELTRIPIVGRLIAPAPTAPDGDRR